MPSQSIDDARYHLMAAYDRITIAQHYLELETIRAAKEAVLWAYLVVRALPEAQAELETEELMMEDAPAF